MARPADVELWQEGTRDMPPAELRRYGHQIIDWISEYLESPQRYPVLSQVAPGDIKAALPSQAPQTGEPMDDILADFERIVLPGITHWNHPAFFAYFAISGSAPGILGELLAAALNVNGMLWRTSPAASELEHVALDWLRQMVGLPAQFEGIIYDTASISTLVAIAAAREMTGLGIREEGMAGRPDLPTLTLYCSDQTHSSVEKDAITLGIGHQNVRKIATDTEFRLDPGRLRATIQQDIDAGHRPFCVVATAGTTSSTSVDPIPQIADICDEFSLWLHVDGAYGGTAAVLPEMRWVLEGAERAHSIVINPHKWLFTPVDCSAFYSRRLDVVRDAFSLVPEYLRTGESDTVRNYMDYGPQLGRRFRALKLWFVLRCYGVEGIQARLREHIRLARELAGWIDASPDWELMAPVPLATVCFRARPAGVDEMELDGLNERIMDRVNATGQAFLSHTKLRGELTLRIAIGHIRTTDEHVRGVWKLLVSALAVELDDSK